MSLPNTVDLRSLVVGFIVVALTIIARFAWKRWQRIQELQSWVKAVLKERELKVHTVLSLEHDGDDEMLNSAQTREMVSGKNISAAQNVIRLAKRCHKYGYGEKGVNAITEELYDEAFEIAKGIDAKVAPDIVPPLYGVPISVKDRHSMKGTRATFGLACRLNQIDKEDCLSVKLLRKAGAIPLCKSNAAQMMLIAETVNRIWGRTRNPWNLSRTAGGSSGGDAALVAMGCIPLALASDGTGSIRTPSCFCGVVGFKPTSNRVSGKGSNTPQKDNRNGKDIVLPGSIGPIGKTVEDCALFMEAICVPEHWKCDRSIPPLPFDHKTYHDSGKLRIGYFDTDHFFQPCASSRRAIRDTIKLLKDSGHECVPFEPPTNGWENVKLMLQITSAEGPMDAQLKALEGEVMLTEYLKMYLQSQTPNLIRWIVSKVGPSRLAYMVKCTRKGGVSVRELWDIIADLIEIRSKWTNAMAEANLDALVFPGWPIPAFENGTVLDSGLGIVYLFIASFLMWPSGVVPITTVRSDEQHYRMGDLPQNQRDQYAKNAAQTMENSAGLPISISVMTTLYEDEKCLRVMREIEQLVKFQTKPTSYLAQ